MPRVSEQQLLANYGEALVAARLAAAGCLVRPVAHGTDFGIDLFCETVAPGKAENKGPFLHFWVQVKTGRQCTRDANGYKCRFKRRHLAYWLRQPVPVFAALVPAEWPVKGGSSDVHVVDLTEPMVAQRVPQCTLRATIAWPVNDLGSVRGFVQENVPRATALLALRSGVVATVPTLKPSYVQSVPVARVSGFRERILDQIRRTASFSTLFMAWAEESHGDFEQHLLAVIGAFQHDRRRKWETYAALGWLHKRRGQTVEAMRQYQAAKSLIERDGNARRLNLDETSWSNTMAWLDNELHGLRGQEPQS